MRPSEYEHMLAAIARRAPEEDRRDGDLSRDIDDLRKSGWLTVCLPGDAGGQGWGTDPEGAEPALAALRALGRANLSVARLFEGHMNATKLVMAYGAAPLRAEVARRVRDGLLLGVWGADVPAAPLQMVAEADAIRLQGAKSYASGLGVVGAAILTAPSENGATQLLLVETDEPERADSSSWNAAGMRATRSGRYDFEGVRIGPDRLIGRPGDYEREPLFEGGVWRYCAAHLGGAEAVYTLMRDALVARDRAGDPHQQRRLVVAACALETARLWLERCAREAEAQAAPPRKAILSLLAREVTEDACRTVLAQAQAALGVGAHLEGSAIERIARDLSLFLCQAGPDAKRARAADALVAHSERIETL